MPIRYSVGSGGHNVRGDVFYVQFLLCDCRCRMLLPPITVDGIVGPETIGAIGAIQKQYSLTVDGRVDPKGPTIAVLEKVHLAGICSNQYSASFREYYPGGSNALMIQRVCAVYLDTLRNGMGEGAPQKHKETPGPEVSGQV